MLTFYFLEVSKVDESMHAHNLLLPRCDNFISCFYFTSLSLNHAYQYDCY